VGLIRIDVDRGLAVVRLDKARGNAIDEPLVRELLAATRRLEEDAAVRGVLLTSANPKIFCPGLDLVTLYDYDRAAMERFMLLFSEMVAALYGLAKPVVAGVNGHAVAGGCILALTADYRVLRRGGAQIGLNEVKVGVPLPWSVAVLLRASPGRPAGGRGRLHRRLPGPAPGVRGEGRPRSRRDQVVPAPRAPRGDAGRRGAAHRRVAGRLVLGRNPRAHARDRGGAHPEGLIAWPRSASARSRSTVAVACC
jgi:hypothetical protein